MYLINYVVQMWIVPMPLLYCAKARVVRREKENKRNGIETRTHV